MQAKNTKHKISQYLILNSCRVSGGSFADSSPRNWTFGRAPVPVGCVVDSIVLARAFLRIFQPFPIFTITPMQHTQYFVIFTNIKSHHSI